MIFKLWGPVLEFQAGDTVDMSHEHDDQCLVNADLIGRCPVIMLIGWLL